MEARWISCLFIVLLICFDANAAGFQLVGHSATQVGRAIAGGSLAGDDVSAAFDNPAEMMLVKTNQIQLSINRSSVAFPFSNTGSTQNIAGITVFSQGQDGDGGTSANIPGVLNVFSLGQNFKFGLAITAPFGLRTDYNPNWVGRYHVIEAGIDVVDINQSIAYSVNSSLSIGAGLSAQYIETELSEAIFTGVADGLAEIKGDNWGYGYNVGVMYSLESGSKVSFSYRSSIDHKLKGNLTTSGLIGLFAANNGTINAETNIELPETITLNAVVPVRADLIFLATVAQTGWSRFDEVRVKLDGNLPDKVITANWKDTWRFSLGSQLMLNRQWTLRTGLLWDQSPVSDESSTLPHIPDSDRRGFHFGLSYIPISTTWRIDLAYARINIDSVNVDRTVETIPGFASNRLLGSYNGSKVDIYAVQVSTTF